MPPIDTDTMDAVKFPNGEYGYVPPGYGAQASQMLAPYMGKAAQGNPGAGNIGNFADGFEAVNQLLGAGDIQRDLDQARLVLVQLDLQRDLYGTQLDTTVPGLPPDKMTLGQRWKLIQSLQDQRDYLQERIAETQIKLNYGSGLAAGGRVIGRMMGGGGGMGSLGGMGGGDNTAVLLGGIGLGVLLLRDRSNSGSVPVQQYAGT